MEILLSHSPKQRTTRFSWTHPYSMTILNLPVSHVCLSVAVLLLSVSPPIVAIPVQIESLMDESEELPPLFPFHLRDYLGFGVAIVGLMLAAGGGIGGGGILVPTYILLLDFPVKHAIPLASATVFGGAVANNLLNAFKRHPDHPHRLVIDWELILQLEPMTILGALMGAVLNDFLPDMVLVIMMFLLLSATAYKTLAKAHTLRKKEDLERKNRESSVVGELKPLLKVDTVDTYVLDDTSATEHTSKQQKEESAISACTAATKLSSLFVVVTVLNLFSGGPGEAGTGPVGSQSCNGACFWVVEVVMVLVILPFVYCARSELLSRVNQGKPVESDISWNDENTILYPCYAIVAGLVAGLFGIGGGIIKGPLMLSLGVHPAVASATSACMILFTSSTATVSYMIFGLLVPDYAAFCLVIGFCSTILGQTVMSLLLRRYRRHSYIAYSIGIVVAVSAVAMSIEYAIDLLE